MIVLYTAIFGGSDSPKPAPAGATRCVLYTDAAIEAQGWEVVRVPAPVNPRGAARNIKMTPHEIFPEATGWLWVDGSIAITDYAGLVAAIGPAEAACFPHPDRTNCYDEGRMVVRLERANPSKVAQALDAYRADGFAPLALSTTGLFYRRNTPNVVAMNRLWREQLDRYGVNDQVHVDYAAWKAGVTMRWLPGNYRDNRFAVYDRADHHRRRSPHYDLGDRCEHYLA